MTQSFAARGCGKFILLGEHFVVHGSPALALPIPELFCEVTVQKSDIIRFLAETENEKPPDLYEKMEASLKAAASALKIQLSDNPLSVSSRSNFALSRGLGSSAAYSVALALALSGYTQRTSDINGAALEIERVFHGNPSGIDTTTIFMKKPIKFQKDRPPLFFENKHVDFVISDGGARTLTTPRLIQTMATLSESKPTLWSELRRQVNALVDEGFSFFKSEGQSPADLAQIVNENHDILRSLNLSTPLIDELIQKTVSLGALTGKVSGAGGGGAIVILARQGEGARLAARMKDNKIPVVGVVAANDSV